MSRFFKTSFLVLVGSLFLVGCGNQTFIDTVYTFNYASVKLPDGSIKDGSVKEWSDYDDGDQIQIKFEDGHTVLVHSSNVVLSVKDLRQPVSE